MVAAKTVSNELLREVYSLFDLLCCLLVNVGVSKILGLTQNI
jgi:hypothetical protein